MDLFFREHPTVLLLLFALVKVAIMLGFFLNLAPLLVFAERRQSALIQDRIGPNRAVVRVHGFILKVMLATPALVAAGLVVLFCFVLFPPTLPGADARGFWLSEIALVLLWAPLLVLVGFIRTETTPAHNGFERFLARMADPRWVFYTGLFAHVALLVAYAMPAEANESLVATGFSYGGPVLLAGVLALSGAYVAYRIPNRVIGLRLGGIFHSIADALKLFFKEDFVPAKADKFLHSLAPLIALFPALVTFAVIPFGDSLCFGGATAGYLDPTTIAPAVGRDGVCPGYTIPLQIADLNVGVLYVFAIAGTGIIGSAIGGWSSDNKWSLMGGIRAASQMVSYEVAMGLSLAGALMIYGTPRLGEMVRWQGENTWGIFVQPLAFFIFFAAAIAEQKRVPFDAPEGESEIVAGYFVEYSSFKFAMFYTGEYIEMVTSSALLVTIFLGGWNIPFLHRDGFTLAFGDSLLGHAALSHVAVTILQVATFFLKVTLLTFWQIFIRWTLPRFRYDQIMSFGWKFLLPAVIANLVVTGLLVLLVGQAGPGVQQALRLVMDLTQAVVVAAVAYCVIRLVLLMLSPVDRVKFTRSGVAARVARLGGIKTEPMQA